MEPVELLDLDQTPGLGELHDLGDVVSETRNVAPVGIPDLGPVQSSRFPL